jgi:bifunctional non-homologous end joining protein LigD
VDVEVEGRVLKLTNLDKVLYPEAGFTKGHVIGYYAAIAPSLLPHLAARPLTLKRYPNGVAAPYFYQKQCPVHRPQWVKTTPLPASRGTKLIDYCVCADLATLVWVANLASLELHPSLSLSDRMDRPTALAFDLDPGPPAGILECCQVALELRDLFTDLGMHAFAKTSGSKGLQVYVPLDATATYADAKPFAHAVAKLLAQRRPQLIVSTMAKAKRAAKVLIDWSQNDPHKTTVCAYSLRALSTPTVSAPLRWEEVRRCLHARDPAMLQFGPAQVLERAQANNDLFAEVLSLRQHLPALKGS